MGGESTKSAVELPETQVAECAGITFRWAALTHCGKVRSVNEDSFLALPGVFAVADGMGGHEAGDVASAVAVRHLAELAGTVPVPVAEVAPSISRLNAELHAHPAAEGSNGMGTTLVAMLLIEADDSDQLVVFNVGDSRCYVSDDLGFRQLTRDHSLVQELVDAGSIDSSEAANHPERNVVTRAVGIEPEVSADFIPLARVGRQRLLLCSDGVSGPIDDVRLAALVKGAADTTQPPEPADVVASMLEAVLDGHAADNATMMIVDVEWPDVGTDADVEITGRFGSHDDAEITAPRPQATASSDTTVGTSRQLISEVPK